MAGNVTDINKITSKRKGKKNVAEFMVSYPTDDGGVYLEKVVGSELR